MDTYRQITNELNKTNTKLIAVSKHRTIAEIMALYEKGQRAFGENRVQELLEKQALLPGDIVWHLIGHLQSNKVKYIAPFVSMIHSADSLKLLFEINKEAQKNQRIIPVLVQVHIANEESKFGVDEKELVEIFEYYTSSDSPLQHIQIRGLMGMATNTDDQTAIANEFSRLRSLHQFIKESYLLHRKDFTELSMGMSSDYRLAIAAGSTMVRIGSLLFS